MTNDVDRKTQLLACLSVAVVLAACGQAAPQPSATPTEPPPSPTAAPASSTPAETEVPDEPTAPPEPTEEGLGPIPQGSPQLRASNPTTVQLAAGEPTLVEFFAFW